MGESGNPVHENDWRQVNEDPQNWEVEWKSKPENQKWNMKIKSETWKSKVKHENNCNRLTQGNKLSTVWPGAELGLDAGQPSFFGDQYA